jgi:magnesium transporter
MPETEWRWAYFAVIGLMAAIGLSMFAYFKRKRWI